MKLAIVGGGQLGRQLFKASRCQRMILGTKPQCPAGLEGAELGYSTDLSAAAGCDVVAVAIPPAACPQVLEELCAALPAGTVVLNFPTKWAMPKELYERYPGLKLLESKLLGSAVGLERGLEGLVVLSQTDPATEQLVKDCMPGLDFTVGAWDKVPYLNAEASRAVLTAAVQLEKKLAAEGFPQEEIKTLMGGLMPGILISYRNDSLGGFGKEFVRSLKA